LEVETTKALKLLRNGIEPPQPTVDGSLRGNYLAKARRDAQVQLEAIERAQQVFQQEQTPPGREFQHALEQARVHSPAPRTPAQRQVEPTLVFDHVAPLAVAVATSGGLDFAPLLPTANQARNTTRTVLVTTPITTRTVVWILATTATTTTTTKRTCKWTPALSPMMMMMMQRVDQLGPAATEP
jgi:hypothetical protein